MYFIIVPSLAQTIFTYLVKQALKFTHPPHSNDPVIPTESPLFKAWVLQGLK